MRSCLNTTKYIWKLRYSEIHGSKVLFPEQIQCPVARLEDDWFMTLVLLWEALSLRRRERMRKLAPVRSIR